MSAEDLPEKGVQHPQAAGNEPNQPEGLPGAGSEMTVGSVSEPGLGVPQWLKNAGVASWATIGIVIVAGAIVVATAKVSAVFLALFVALVFTSLLNPVVNWMSKFIKRWISVVLSLLAAIAIFAGLMTFVVGSVAGQWSKLANQLAQGLDKIVEFINRTPFQINLTSDEIYDWYHQMLTKGQEYVTQNWSKLASTVMSNAGGIAVFFTVLALAIFITVFFLLQGSQMWRWFLNMLPTRTRGSWNHAAQAGWNAFSGYARGTMIIAFIDGVLVWIFLEILRVPLAPALGVLVMIGALIPMVGAPAAMVVAMIVALATDGVWTAVIVGIGIAAVGQLEGHVLQPLIMGKQVSLHPVVVGVGVVAGTLLGGLLGAIIAIPIIGVAWAVFNSLYHREPPIEGPLPNSDPSEKKPEKHHFRNFLAKIFRRQDHASSQKDKESNVADNSVTVSESNEVVQGSEG